MQTPILFFQWRPHDELDELDEAKTLLENELRRRGEGTPPAITTYTCLSSDPAKFADELQGELEKLPGIQVLYLSAHGLDDAIARDREGKSKLLFAELAESLSRGLERASNVTAVFGLCFALSQSSYLLDALPCAIVEAYGFTSTPTDNDVAALIAGVLADYVALTADIGTQHRALLGTGIPLEEAQSTLDELGCIVDAAVARHEENHEPESLVDGRTGGSVRQVRRGDDGNWETVTSVAVPGRSGRNRDA